MLAGLFSSLFGRLLGGRRRVLAAVLSAASIALYTVLVGATASVVRAALMGGLGLFARQLGRRQDGLNSLAFVAALMALANPLSLGDPGFQLSFTATLGLILYAEPLTLAFSRFASRRLPPAAVKRLAGPVGEYLLFTLAAQLLSLPVTLSHFRRLSLVAAVANPAILPAQPPLMVLGGLAVVAGMVSLPAGRLLGLLAWPFAAYTIRAVELFARVPGGSLSLGHLSLPAVAAIYALILGWTGLVPRFRKAAAALGPATALLALGALAGVVWQAALSAPDGRLHATVLEVGAGDAILIQTPAGRSLLVDGGPSPIRLADGLGRRLPLAHRQLDLLVIAAGEEEQVGGLPRLVERDPPGGILWAGPPQGTYASRRLLEAVNELELPVTPAVSGQAVDLGQGAWLKVLYAGERGAVLLLEWRNFRLLLPVGVDFAAFEALEYGRAVGPVSALLLADSGYAPSNPPEWIDALHPQLVLLSVDAADRRGLPSPETLEAVRGYPLLRTDRNGWIEIETDGERMWVEVEKP